MGDIDLQTFQRKTGLDAPALRLVSNVPLFKGLRQADLCDLLLDASARRYEDGTLLFLQGDQADRFYVVLDGWVKLLRQGRDGQEAVIAVFTRGESFAEAAMFESGSFPVTGVVVGRSRLLVVPAQPFMRKVGDKVHVCFNMMASMSRHLRHLVRQVEQLTLRSSEQRLAAFLVQLADARDGAAQVHLPVEKALIAARLGMQPETLSRGLARLRRVGVVVHAREVEIPDVAALRALVEGQESA